MVIAFSTTLKYNDTLNSYRRDSTRRKTALNLLSFFPDANKLAEGLENQDLEVGVNLIIDRAVERGGGHNNTGIVCGGGARHQVGDALAAERRISVLKHIPIFAHLTYNELVKVVGLTQLMRVGSGRSRAVRDLYRRRRGRCGVIAR